MTKCINETRWVDALGRRIRKKKRCPCQSCMDRSKSHSITSQHKIGHGCGKRASWCAICCRVRGLGKQLRHYGGMCPGKRCPVCDWAKHPDQEFNVELHRSLLENGTTTTMLYKICLLGKWL